MKKNGFTLVELITTFALTTVIIVLLINVVLLIKNIYSKTNVKTELYINQSNLSNALNSKINNNDLVSYEPCTDSEFCYEFNFRNDESIKLIVEKDKIKFGDYIYKLGNKTRVENATLTPDEDLLILKIPIVSDIYPNIDFGINLVYVGNIEKYVQ